MANVIRIFLADTCVISDFIKCKCDCLNELRNCNCKILVLQEVYDELLNSFERDEIDNNFVEIINAETEDYEQMLEIKSSKLSYVDKLCLSVSKRQNLCLITKDKLLYNKCTEYGIEVKWSLELLIHLCENKVIDKNILTKWANLEKIRIF